MALLETATGPLAYDERGEGDPIVLLSSGAHDRHDFDELRDLLPARFRTIAPDWPAHGESPPGSAPATAMRFADVAEELVEALAPGGAVVVGNSVGGFAAGRMAIRRPDLVKGLVLVDSGGFGGRPPQVRAFCALMSRPGFLRRIYPRFADRYMRPRSDADRRVRDAGVATTREDPGLGAVAELWGSFSSPEHDLRAGRSLDLGPDAGRLGQARPGHPAEAGAPGGGLDPGGRAGRSSIPATRPRSATPRASPRSSIPFADAASSARMSPAMSEPHRWRSRAARRAADGSRWSGGSLECFERGSGPGAPLQPRLARQRQPLAQGRRPARRASSAAWSLDLPLGSHRTADGRRCRPRPGRRRRPDRRRGRAARTSRTRPWSATTPAAPTRRSP